jgi:hypothetical protein
MLKPIHNAGIGPFMYGKTADISAVKHDFSAGEFIDTHDQFGNGGFT